MDKILTLAGCLMLAGFAVACGGCALLWIIGG